jgi:hypothetical protein
MSSLPRREVEDDYKVSATAVTCTGVGELLGAYLKDLRKSEAPVGIVPYGRMAELMHVSPELGPIRLNEEH